MEISVECADCGRELDVEWEPSGGRQGRHDPVLEVEICSSCLKDAIELARAEAPEE